MGAERSPRPSFREMQDAANAPVTLTLILTNREGRIIGGDSDKSLGGRGRRCRFQLPSWGSTSPSGKGETQTPLLFKNREVKVKGAQVVGILEGSILTPSSYTDPTRRRGGKTRTRRPPSRSGRARRDGTRQGGTWRGHTDPDLGPQPAAQAPSRSQGFNQDGVLLSVEVTSKVRKPGNDEPGEAQTRPQPPRAFRQGERGSRRGRKQDTHGRGHRGRGWTEEAAPEPQEAACGQVQDPGLSGRVPTPAPQLPRGGPQPGHSAAVKRGFQHR